MTSPDNSNYNKKLDNTITVDFLGALGGYGGFVITSAGAIASQIANNPEMVKASLETAIMFLAIGLLSTVQGVSNFSRSSKSS